jgi:hypothetical protein
MASSGQEPGKREITYRVGWKKGKIAPSGKAPVRSETVEAEAGTVERWMRRWAWRPVPFIPDNILPIALWTLPAVSFAVTVWLAYMLADG